MSQMFMILAGEVSGDLLGADLIRELKKEYPQAVFWGVGGKGMQEEGLSSLFPMEELSLMGITEVLPHIPKLFKRRDELVEAALDRRPAVLITIDAPDFNLRVAAKIKEALGVPCIHYVSPSVWAWRQNRIYKMAKYLDHVLALFPFEPDIYAKANLNCTFVGHPLAVRMQPHVPEKVMMPEEEHLIAMLPGSRTGEITRLLPAMVQTLDILKTKDSKLKAVLPLAQERHRKLIRSIIGNRRDIKVVKGDMRFNAMKDCRAAIAASGTANLELAMQGLPMVVAYKMASLTYHIAKFLVKIPYMSPVNWVAGSKIVPEFLQNEVKPEAMANSLWPLMSEENVWKAQAKPLAQVRKQLKGKKNPAENAVKVIATYLPRSKKKVVKNPNQQSFDF